MGWEQGQSAGARGPAMFQVGAQSSPGEELVVLD